MDFTVPLKTPLIRNKKMSTVQTTVGVTIVVLTYTNYASTTFGLEWYQYIVSLAYFIKFVFILVPEKKNEVIHLLGIFDQVLSKARSTKKNSKVCWGFKYK